jgi:molybdopterin-guanine dinucleotide biosynthesis protein A
MISVEGYVLAGGLSSRMGRKKANIMLGDTTLAERAVVALSAITGNVAVVGNIEVNEPLVRVVPDEPAKSDSRGAIVGLYSALRNAKTEWTAVLACDLPFVTSELVVRLARMAESLPDAACVVPVQPDGRTQPLCGIYRTAKRRRLATSESA